MAAAERSGQNGVGANRYLVEKVPPVDGETPMPIVCRKRETCVEHLAALYESPIIVRKERFVAVIVIHPRGQDADGA